MTKVNSYFDEIYPLRTSEINIKRKKVKLTEFYKIVSPIIIKMVERDKN